MMHVKGVRSWFGTLHRYANYNSLMEKGTVNISYHSLGNRNILMKFNKCTHEARKT